MNSKQLLERFSSLYDVAQDLRPSFQTCVEEFWAYHRTNLGSVHSESSKLSKIREDNQMWVSFITKVNKKYGLGLSDDAFKGTVKQLSPVLFSYVWPTES